MLNFPPRYCLYSLRGKEILKLFAFQKSRIMLYTLKGKDEGIPPTRQNQAALLGISNNNYKTSWLPLRSSKGDTMAMK